MFPFPSVQVGRGLNGQFTIRGRFWSSLVANNLPTQVAPGRILCADLAQRGAAALVSVTDGTTSTRSVSGSTPNYDTLQGDNDLLSNYVFASAAAANRVAGIYVGPKVALSGDTVELGIAGRFNNVFAVGTNSGGNVAIAIGDPLTVSITVTSSTATDPLLLGRACKAASGEYIQGVALSALGSGTSGLIDVLWFGYPMGKA